MSVRASQQIPLRGTWPGKATLANKEKMLSKKQECQDYLLN